METTLQTPSLNRRLAAYSFNAGIAVFVAWLVTRDLRWALAQFLLLAFLSYFTLRATSLARLALTPYVCMTIALGFHTLWRVQGLSP